MSLLNIKIGCVILASLFLLAILPIAPMTAANGPAVQFERIHVSPVDITFKVTVSGITGDYPAKVEFGDMSAEAQIVEVLNVYQESYIVQEPIYKTVDTTVADLLATVEDFGESLPLPILNYLNSKASTKPLKELPEGLEKKLEGWDNATGRVGLTKQVVAGVKDVTKVRTVKPQIAKFTKNDSKKQFSIALQSTKVYEVTSNTGTVRNPDTGGYGSKGLLILDIGGVKYFDKINSSWWNSSWAYREKLTFLNAAVGTAVTNPLVTANFTATNLDFSHCLSNGYDLRFVDADNATNLKYFRANWDNVTETAEFILQVPQIDGTDTDYVWAYYGNANAPDGEDKSFTTDIVLNDPLWSSRLSASPFNSVDSYSRSNTVTDATWGITGRTFDGANDAIFLSTVGTPFDLQAFTILAWIKRGTIGANHCIFSNFKSDGTYGWNFAVSDTNKLYFVGLTSGGSPLFTITSTGTLAVNTWYLVGVTCPGNGLTATLYINSVADGTATQQTLVYNTSLPKIGENSEGGGDYSGIIGEVLFYNQVLSGTKILGYQGAVKQRYVGGDSYITYGAEEGLQSGLAPISLTLTDLGAISIGASWVSGNFSDYVMIRVKRNEYPTSVSNGELAYYDNGPADNFSGYALETTTYYFRAWGFLSDNTTHSNEYVEASIGGEDMADIATQLTAFNLILAGFNPSLIEIFELALLIGFLALAYWRQEEVLFAVSAVITILIAFEWIATYPGIAVILWVFGLYLVGFKVLIPIMQGGTARGFSQFKAMFHRVKGED